MCFFFFRLIFFNRQPLYEIALLSTTHAATTPIRSRVSTKILRHLPNPLPVWYRLRKPAPKLLKTIQTSTPSHKEETQVAKLAKISVIKS